VSVLSVIWQWMVLNPSASKGYAVTFLALVVKLVLQLTGKADQLDQWNSALGQLLDLIWMGATAYGALIGLIHTSRGPLQTPVNQVATIVAAIQGPPSPMAVDQAKAATEEVKAQQ
jgi:hypothetical protein